MAWILALTGAALGLAAPCQAQMLELRPVLLQFDAAHPTQAFGLTNRAPGAATVQIRVFKWSQGPNGDDVLVPAEDMIVSPPFVQLGGGEVQVVRVRYLGGQGSAEGSYRLLVDQLPALDPGKAGVRVALRLSMPAFVAGADKGGPKVNWTWTQDETGHTLLTVANHGAAHTRISDLRITLPSGEPFAPPASGSAYLLGGVVRRWRLDGTLLSPPSFSPSPALKVAGGP